MTTRSVTIEEQAASIARRMSVLGWSAVPAVGNDGTRRTAEKRRLLTAIAEQAEARNRQPAFAAAFIPLPQK